MAFGIYIMHPHPFQQQLQNLTITLFDVLYCVVQMLMRRRLMRRQQQPASPRRRTKRARRT